MLLWLAACGTTATHTTDIKPTLVLADRTPTEIVRLLNAAVGLDILGSTKAFDIGEFITCPTAEYDDQAHVATLYGGCTNYNGDIRLGQATETGVLAPCQAQRPRTVQFDGWSITRAGSMMQYDGRVLAYPDDADLVVTLDGVGLRSDLAFSCRVISEVCDNECTRRRTLEGSGLELVGIGGVLISGTWEIHYPPYGPTFAELSLLGADTLTTTSSPPDTWQWQITAE